MQHAGEISLLSHVDFPGGRQQLQLPSELYPSDLLSILKVIGASCELLLLVLYCRCVWRNRLCITNLTENHPFLIVCNCASVVKCCRCEDFTFTNWKEAICGDYLIDSPTRTYDAYTHPEHAIPETVSLQVVCNDQMIAQSEFIYYASAQYNSDMLFQYLSQNLPSYFHQAELGGRAMGGATGGLGGGRYKYSGSIPSSTFGLLLGGCCLGIEPLVYATLHLPSMEKISISSSRRPATLLRSLGMTPSLWSTWARSWNHACLWAIVVSGARRMVRRDLPSQMRPSSSGAAG